MQTQALFWNSYARCYDRLQESIPYQQLVHQTLACVPDGVAALLDAGCGTGNLLAAIRRRHPALKLHGIDFSEAMLRRAKARLPDAQLRAANLNGPLPFPDASFDVVTCINVLYAVASPKHTLAELRRVLKPGGTLIASGPSAQPRMSSFVRAHAAEAGWTRTIPLLLRSVEVILFNFVILQRGGAGKYHFLDQQAVQELLACQTITRAYANQNWFACAIKDSSYELNRNQTPGLRR